MINTSSLFRKPKLPPSRQRTTYFIDLNTNNHLRKKVGKVILFTNARDELCIKEWIAHHLILGFNLIYIFDHKSKNPLAEVLRGFDPRVIVEPCLLESAPKLPLMKRAAHIAARLAADWFIYLDVDEFIVLNKFQRVQEMLLRFSPADSLALNWVMFGSNFHKSDPPGLVIENYTKSEGHFDHLVKSFVRPSQISALCADNPHFYHIVDDTRMFAVTGEHVKQKFSNNTQKKIGEAPAFIAHYVYQSEESYTRRKLLLPSDDTGTFREGDAQHIHSRYNDIDNMAVKKYVKGIKAFLKLEDEETAEKLTVKQKQN
jgi:hypothetical protein